MKIGILTYCQTQDNYGQVLQCYALQSVLNDMGHEPYVINYDSENGIHKVSLMKRFARIFLYPIYIRRKRRREKEKEARRQRLSVRHFDEFRLKHFTFSDTFYKSLNALRDAPPQADCYIAGSDQLWGRLLSNPENEVYFLAFGGNVRRVAYACSFGMKEYPKELRPVLKKNLERFHKVSCREYDGVAICADLGIDAKKNLDPTLIANTDIYRRLMEKSPYTCDYAYIYSLNISQPAELRWSELNSYMREKSLKPIVTISSGYIEGKDIYENVTYSYATIEQWLTNIAHARFVVTTSFHGVVFCILLHRPFVYVPLAGKFAASNNRALDLFNDLHINGRVLNDETTYASILSSNIDWKETGSCLKSLQAESLEYLRTSLMSN